MIRPLPQQIDTLSIVSDFDRSLYEAFQRAIDRSQRLVWKEILDFIQKQTITAYDKNSFPVIEQFAWMPSALYQTATKNDEIANEIVSSFASFYRIVSTLFQPKEPKNEFITASLPRFNKFYESVLEFYHYIIYHKDTQVLISALNQFDQMKSDRDDYDLRTLIERKGMQGASTAEKRSAWDKATEENLYNVTHRRATLYLISWIVYLFAIDKISFERFSILLSHIEIQYTFFEDFLEDIIYVRRYDRANFLGIGFWDHTERPSGQGYSPPTPSDWIIYGPCLLLMKGDIPYFMPEAVIDDRDHAFLYDEFKRKLGFFKQNLDKWIQPLGLAANAGVSAEERVNQIKETFEEKERQILNIFEQLKVTHAALENEEIANQNLKEVLVNDFKATLYERWLTQCISYRLFDQYGKLNPVNSKDELPYYGSEILLDQFKMMFVESKYQKIYGSGDLGSVVGRETDQRFIGKILESSLISVQTVPFNSPQEGIDISIEELAKDGIYADIIIIPAEFSYKTDLVSSSKFRRDNTVKELHRIGYYDKIPVVTFLSKMLTKQVIVASFKTAFSLDLYESDTLYGGRLHVEIRELTDEEITREYDKNSEKWTKDQDGFILTEQQAKLRIATSVILELWSRGKFNIDYPEAVKKFDVNFDVKSIN